MQIHDGSQSQWTPRQVSHEDLRRTSTLTSAEFRSGKAGDIVSTLVSIYETREVIIKELQVLLAARLLAVRDYDAVKEVRSMIGAQLILDPYNRAAQDTLR